MVEKLFLGGASVRAAARSARNAGLIPLCADLFADEDLQCIAQTTKVSRYPEGLITAAEALGDCPWMYSGALENHPHVITEISRQHPLWGNPPEVLAKVRDPFWIHDQLEQADLPRLKLSLGQPPPGNLQQEWLHKPRCSAGGHRITHGSQSGVPHPDTYYQEFKSGLPISATLFSDQHNCYLLGVTWQWVGYPALGAAEVAYCGSYGPLQLPIRITDQIRKIARVMCNRGGLIGLFGLDLIIRGQMVYLIEINPRYTASMELLEQAAEDSLISIQKELFNSADAELASLCQSFANNVVAQHAHFVKAILFAENQYEFPEMDGEILSASNSTRIADRPTAGTVIDVGQPICTVIALGNSPASTLANLQHGFSSLNRDSAQSWERLAVNLTPHLELLQKYSGDQ